MAQREYKLVFTGPMGAGKTTAIRAISQVRTVATDVENTDLNNRFKETTTAALDYGEVTLAGGDKLRLYGTPGQERFDFMWKIVSKGALGVVILIDNTRPDPVADLTIYLKAFADIVERSHAVIGVGRTEMSPTPTISQFHELANSMGVAVPVFSVDVRERDDVLLLLDVLFHQIEVRDADEEFQTNGEA